MDSVVHFEVPFDDAERATTFYREAFGWKLDSMPDFAYTMVTTTATDERGRPSEPGGINGGMLKRGQITSPVITINVEDIDDALARVEKLGGQVAIGRQPVGEMGFSAYVRDTEGNLIGLWQNA